ncbi:MAG: hypothetical protein Q8K75_02190 [Chlamydiales bacterium]|nr:hypothetical protein [Chlamydiales bacterium]
MNYADYNKPHHIQPHTKRDDLTSKINSSTLPPETFNFSTAPSEFNNENLVAINLTENPLLEGFNISNHFDEQDPSVEPTWNLFCNEYNQTQNQNEQTAILGDEPCDVLQVNSSAMKLLNENYCAGPNQPCIKLTIKKKSLQKHEETSNNFPTSKLSKNFLEQFNANSKIFSANTHLTSSISSAQVTPSIPYLKSFFDDFKSALSAHPQNPATDIQQILAVKWKLSNRSVTRVISDFLKESTSDMEWIEPLVNYATRLNARNYYYYKKNYPHLSLPSKKKLSKNE